MSVDRDAISSGTLVVTGAASARGIGRGLARRITREGRPLVLLDRDAAGLGEAVDELAGLGANVRGLPLDITDADAVDTALRRRATGQIDAPTSPPNE